MRNKKTQLLIFATIVALAVYGLSIAFYTEFGNNSPRVLLLMNILPTLSIFPMGYCYLPQLWQTIKTKSVDDISLQFFGFLNVALTLLLTNSILLYTQNGNWGYVISYIVNEGFALWMLILILLYRKK